MSISEALKKSSQKEYGEHYQSHVLEMYKLYVDMADRISSRRQTANSFFLSINSAIIGFAGFVKISEPKNFNWILPIAGILLCYTWYRLVRSYRDLNTGKLQIIHEIEKELPIAPYDAEWEAVGRGTNPKLYLPFTKTELIVPWIFAAIHLISVIILSPWC